MKYNKFNKYEKAQVRHDQIERAMHGEGLYLFENHTPADLTLPRPTKSGTRVVRSKAQFQGDDYYLQLVRSGHLRLIKELLSPEQERAAMQPQEEKLILDQPDTVTDKGKVEHVVDKTPKVRKLNEGDNDPQEEVLLNESPSGFVIVGN
jgi:hypothetical protein